MIRESDSLWKKVILAKYGYEKEALLPNKTMRGKPSSLWKNSVSSLMNEDDYVVVNCKCVVGNGNRIDFWEDHWTEVTSLRESFPRIFRIANQKSGKAILQRLPTTVEPLKLEMLLEDSNLCAICKQHPESVNHVLCHSEIAWRIWERWCKLWKVQIVFPEDIKSMLFIWNGDSCRKEVKPVWLLSFFSFIGQFECIFKKSQFTEENIFDIGLLKTGVWANCKWPRLVPSVQDFIRCP
ncbi:uncharacterized protein LOC120187843 [Hibiscus syriacus]|uniref:uncharacterized protein LOC120187843 n=1 Tax=Hibiscus syriacus TaxID=106335 RepID=UPI0019224865|nr:uncharacterized protein LOC120187843 [Hibiscus syriacus]